MERLALVALLSGVWSCAGPSAFVVAHADSLQTRVNEIQKGVESTGPIVGHACEFVRAIKGRRELKEACDTAEVLYKSSAAAIHTATMVINIYGDTGVFGDAVTRGIDRVERDWVRLQAAVDFLARTVKHERDQINSRLPEQPAREATSGSDPPSQGPTNEDTGGDEGS